MVPDELIPFSDVAKKFRVSVPTVIAWHRVGSGRDSHGEPIRLDAIKPGRAYLTTWKHVDEFMDRRGQSFKKSEIREQRSKRSAYYEAKVKARLGIS